MFNRVSSSAAKSSFRSKDNSSSSSLTSGGGGGAASGNASIPAHPLSICADCGQTGAAWASLNRGVMLCSDCASVHRSLGRHVSHIKCLKWQTSSASGWIQEQLTMVQSLYSCGANSIWEYSLLNPAVTSSSSSSTTGGASSKVPRKKPSLSDPLHPIKSDFITAKYQNLAFVYKPAKDEPLVTQSELSRQLHSSVRTPNLETSLRLLSQGADPNYYHPEKNSTPLQVAAKAGQACQVELLLVYGADPGAVDKMGRSAAQYAKQAGHGGVANRLINAQFELSDRLSYFLCQKRPDHAAGVHFLIPEDTTLGLNPNDETRRLAKRKLQGLNNKVFEELAMDIHDEVDRRETDADWAALESMGGGSAPSKSAVIIPFLPVNPEYGTARNQGRQKLARLNAREFASLVRDVLKEIKRRQTEMNAASSVSPMRETAPNTLRGALKLSQTKSLPVQKLLQQQPMLGRQLISSLASDDEPIYDHVASDDDYYHIPEKSEDTSSSSQQRPASDGQATNSSLTSSPSKSQGQSSSSFRRSQLQQSQPLPSVPSSYSGRLSSLPPEYQLLKNQLENSEAKVQKLIESNDDMRSEISRLSATVGKLVTENEQLKHYSLNNTPTHHMYNNGGGETNPSALSSATANLIRGVDGSLPYADSSSTRGISPGPNSNHFPAMASHSSLLASPSRTTNTVSMYEQRGSPLVSSSAHGGGPSISTAAAGGPNSLPGNNYMTLQPNSSPNRYATVTSRPTPPPPPLSTRIQQPTPVDAHHYSEARDVRSGSLGSIGRQQPPHQQQQPQHTHSPSVSSSLDESFPLPSQEEVVRRTEAITRCIQELLVSAKDEQFEAFIPCSERIVRAVTDMVLLFPEEPEDSSIAQALGALTAAATHFETECRILIVRSQSEPLNQGFVTQQVIQCAFDIAKSTKQLVALFQ